MTYASRCADCPSGVNKPLTPKRRYRITENDQYAAFLRRVIRAYSRRIASGDIEAITTMAALADDWRPTGFVDTYIMPFAPFLCQLRVHTRRASDTPVPSESSDDCSTLPRIRTKPA